jgi:hypothetical protein
MTTNRITLTLFILSLVAFGTLYYLITYTDVLFQDIDPSLTAPTASNATTTQPQSSATSSDVR